MSRNLWTMIAAVAVIVAMTVIMKLVPPAAVASADPPAGGAAKAGPAPKTTWGDPDLQGIWTSKYQTPLERPAKYANKLTLTEEERADLDQVRAKSARRDTRAQRGTESDVAGAYNAVFQSMKATGPRTSLIVDPPDGRIPALVPLTPEREKRRAAVEEAGRRFNSGTPDSYLDAALPMRCIIRTDRPPYLPIIYNNTFQIFQSPGYVVISVEMIHSARIIPVDGRPHIGKSLHQWLGDSRARWEGSTLVVETTNFRSDDGVVYGNADPETFRIVERFERVDPNRINYTFTVEDPRTWTRPWTAMIPWNKTEDQLYEYACHEDNYDMVHFLAGARAREKAAGGAAKKEAR